MRLAPLALAALLACASLAAPLVDAAPASRAFAATKEECRFLEETGDTCSLTMSGLIEAECSGKRCAIRVLGEAASDSTLPGHRRVQLTARMLIWENLSGSTQTMTVCGNNALNRPASCSGDLRFSTDVLLKSCQGISVVATHIESFTLGTTLVRTWYVCRSAEGALTIDDTETQPPAPPAPQFFQRLALPPDTYVALRVNMSAGNDIIVDMELRARIARGDAGPLSIIRGSLWNGSSMGLHAFGWSHPTNAEAFVAGHRFEAPDPLFTSGYGGSGHGLGPAKHEQTWVFILGTAGAPSEIDVAMWHTKGLISFDLVTAPAFARTRSEFDGLAHASVGSGSLSASAGVDAHTTWSPTNDAIGLFQPRYQGDHGHVSATCAKDGGECPGFSGASYDMRSKGPTTWRLGIPAAAEPFRGAHHAVVGVEFPDGSYLR